MRTPTFVFLALLAAPAAAQTVTSSAAVTGTLVNSGLTCFSQSSWYHTLQPGPLPTGTTSLPTTPNWLTGDFSWSTAPSSLSLTSSGTSGVCSFTGQGGHYDHQGEVTVTLVAPFDTAVEITALGSVSTSSGYGHNTTVAKVDGVTFATLHKASYSSSASVNQTIIVIVGPSGVDLTLNHDSGLAAPTFGTVSMTSTFDLTWSALDAAAVATVAGGCAAPTQAPTLAANGLPTIGGAMDMDILGAQGPAPLGFVMFGLEQASIPLDGIGMPGCTATQPQWISLIAQPTGPDTLTLNVPLPNQAWLIGVQLYTQAFTQAVGANPRGLVAGNGLKWRIGS